MIIFNPFEAGYVIHILLKNPNPSERNIEILCITRFFTFSFPKKVLTNRVLLTNRVMHSDYFCSIKSTRPLSRKFIRPF